MPQSRSSSLVLSVFLVGVGASAQGGLITVKQDGGGDYTTIQDAVDNAAMGDTIEVYSGTYVAANSADAQVVSISGGLSLTIEAAAGESVTIYGEGARRGMYCAFSGDQLVLNGLVFYACDAGVAYGSGLFASGAGGSLSVSNCTFDSCTTAGAGGGAAVTAANATFSNCSFHQNNALTGAGLNLWSSTESPTWTVTDCEFWDCWATLDGGGVVVQGGTLNTSGCTWDANDAGDDGGAIFATGNTTVTMTNDEFVDNVAGDDGGAVLVVSGSSVTLTDCTARDNSGVDGGTVYCDGTFNAVNTSVESSVATSTGGFMAMGATATAQLDGCHVFWNTAPTGNDVFAIAGSMLTLNTTIFQGDGWMTGNAVYSPNATLSCTGTTMCEYLAGGHIQGTWTDGGGNVLGGWCCPGDVTSSDVVDVSDLSDFLDMWNSPTVLTSDREDVDRNGEIGIVDLLEMLRYWGACQLVAPPAT